MTVQELIDELQKIEDKTKEVYYDLDEDWYSVERINQLGNSLILSDLE